MTQTEKNITAQTPADLQQLIVEGIQERKGHGISIVDLTAIESAPASKFIICEGNSSQQVASIADSVREYLLEHARVKPMNYDGYRNAQWIVIDYGSTLVHVFTREFRALYDLEALWNDAVITRVADLD